MAAIIKKVDDMVEAGNSERDALRYMDISVEKFSKFKKYVN